MNTRTPLLLMFVAGATFLSTGLALGQEKEGAEIQKILDTNLPKLKAQKALDRSFAISAIHDNLLTIWNKQHQLPLMDSRKKLSEALIDVYSHSADKDYPEPGQKKEIIQTVALFGDDVVGKKFVLRLLNNGSKDERSAALAVVGLVGTSGNDVYDAVESLAKRGTIDSKIAPGVLTRLNKDRALPDLIHTVKTSRDTQQFMYAAWALQDSYRRPEDYKLILPRLKELGFGKPRAYKDTNGLFWVDPGIFSSYLDQAEGEDLRLALEYVDAHDEFRRPASTPALIHRLDHNDPEIRALAARALGRESEWSGDEGEKIRPALSQAMGKETDARAKKSMQDAMIRLERFQKSLRDQMKRSGKGNTP